jgi:hypothetical protein
MRKIKLEVSELEAAIIRHALCHLRSEDRGALRLELTDAGKNRINARINASLELDDRIGCAECRAAGGVPLE